MMRAGSCQNRQLLVAYLGNYLSGRWDMVGRTPMLVVSPWGVRSVRVSPYGVRSVRLGLVGAPSGRVMESRAFEGAVSFNSSDMINRDSGAPGAAPISPRGPCFRFQK